MTDNESHNLKPIIILLTGASNSGKSTTANALKSHHTHLIRGDNVIYTLPKWCKNKNCCDIYHDYAKICKNNELEKHLNILANDLNEHCAGKFVSHLVNSSLLKTRKSVIIMEGYIFGLSHVKEELCTQLKDTYYIWEMSKLQFP